MHELVISVVALFYVFTCYSLTLTHIDMKGRNMTKQLGRGGGVVVAHPHAQPVPQKKPIEQHKYRWVVVLGWGGSEKKNHWRNNTQENAVDGRARMRTRRRAQTTYWEKNFRKHSDQWLKIKQKLAWNLTALGFGRSLFLRIACVYVSSTCASSSASVWLGSLPNALTSSTKVPSASALQLTYS